MAPHFANGIPTRLSMWQRVREYAVPLSMIETATARRTAGDWAGACAAARVDVDLDLRAVRHRHGTELVTRLRADLRRLAPDLLRWHMPRIAPDGRLRPGLTLSLVRYPGSLHLVVRTPPAWADAGQRISLALWEESGGSSSGHHPHPYPDRRFRLDLHRHLWDAGRSGELTRRCAAAGTPDSSWATSSWAAEAALLRDGGHGNGGLARPCAAAGTPDSSWATASWTAEAELLLRDEGHGNGEPAHRGAAVGTPDSSWATASWTAEAELLLRDGGHGNGEPAHRGAAVGTPDSSWATASWTAEAELLLRDGGRARGAFTVRLGARSRAVLELVAPDDSHAPTLRPLRQPLPPQEVAALPVLPEAAARVLPDLELLRAGLISADRLHPLVAAALTAYGSAPVARPVPEPGDPHRVECRGEVHRIALRDGALTAVDHDPAELRREELLVALGGPALPCLRAIDAVHRSPEALPAVRERLGHGDVAGALAVVEGLLGPGAMLRDGPLREELESAADRRIEHGLFRSGLVAVHPAAGGADGAGRTDSGRADSGRAKPGRAEPDHRPRLDRRTPDEWRRKRASRARPRTGLELLTGLTS